MIGRLVLLLIAANLVWAAWSQGWLRGVGLEGPRPQTEPERLDRQVHPDALRLQREAPGTAANGRQAGPRPAEGPSATSKAPSEAAPAVAAASAPEPAPAAGGTCLQAGLFDEAQIGAVRRAAAGLPAGSWRVDTVAQAGRWMVYIGKLADADAVRTKRGELRDLGVDTDRPGPGLEPGLSLGRFSSEEAAQRALSDLGRKGVRTARVVQERRDTPAYQLRLPSADAELRQQAARSLRGVLGGKDLRLCE